MDVQKFVVHMVMAGGVELKFIANSVNVSSDNEAYVFTSFPGSNNYTVLEPVQKSDIAFISLETKMVSGPPETNTLEDSEQDHDNG